MRVYNRLLHDNNLARPNFNPDYYYHGECFNNEEVDKICLLKRNYTFSRGTTIGKNSKTTNSDVRESQIFFVNQDANTQWIYDRIAWHIAEANKNWGFTLTAMEKMQYTKYNGPDIISMDEKIQVRSHRDIKNKKGHYNWHMDLGKTDGSHSSATRKASIVVSLSDTATYTGGKLLTWTGSGEITHPGKRGSCVVFPSFILHKVNPVESGIRESLVCWIQGPTFT